MLTDSPNIVLPYQPFFVLVVDRPQSQLDSYLRNCESHSQAGLANSTIKHQVLRDLGQCKHETANCGPWLRVTRQTSYLQTAFNSTRSPYFITARALGLFIGMMFTFHFPFDLLSDKQFFQFIGFVIFVRSS